MSKLNNCLEKLKQYCSILSCWLLTANKETSSKCAGHAKSLTYSGGAQRMSKNREKICFADLPLVR